VLNSIRFTNTSELQKTPGARTYPVADGFDPQGRTKTMTNWSTYPSTGARVTTWNYNTNRGWLDNKRYPDNTGPAYTYTPAGRLNTRVWARGTTTSYTTNSVGDITRISYSDGVTASVTNTFDRRGRASAVAQDTNLVSMNGS
jgi:YD repeat-containing protein